MKVIVLLRADASSEAGAMPDQDLLRRMGQYNEELVNAGVMLACEGLHPSSRGARVLFQGGDRSVVPGPFPLSEGLLSGFWIWRVASLEEAIRWVERCPAPHAGDFAIETRPLFEAEAFGSEFTPELREQERKLRERVGQQA